MILYFLRHASAGQRKAAPSEDEKRPLDKEGVRQCRHIGRLLAAMDFEVDVILSSPLKRATQTASLVANEVGYERKIEIDAALRPDASFVTFRRMLDKHAKQEGVMVVGHNPSITEFLSLVVTNGASDTAVDMKKGAIARVDMKGTRSGLLIWCVTPKIARAAYDSPTTKSSPKTSRK
jgi:phosphohistidine phosphatase